jgi:uncharacterized caspase-like protein
LTALATGLPTLYTSPVVDGLWSTFVRFIARSLVLLITIVAALAAPAGAQQSATARVALVIGNGAYQHTAPLSNPANDAGDMAATLRELGFTVIEGIDLTKRALELKTREFAGHLAGAETAVLFYAGHGLSVGGVNYLIPVDARLAAERDLDFDAVRVDFILRQMEIDRESRTSIVFLDACRDNPLARNLARSMGTRSAAIGQGLSQINSGVGTFISFSTQPGNVALDGQGRNSPYTAALLKHIRLAARPLTTMLTEVRREVLAATSGRQVPWDHSALTGEFYFIPPAAAVPGAAGAPVAPPGASPAEIAALQERMKQLEEELKKRPAATPTGPPRADQRYTLRRNNALDGTFLEEAWVATFVGCTDRCDRTQGCIGFEHRDSSQSCRLYSAVTNRREEQGWNSGVRFSTATR